MTLIGPFEKPSHKLGLRVSSGFLNTWNTKALGLCLCAYISFLLFGNHDETLAQVYEILLLKLINNSSSFTPMKHCLAFDIFMSHVSVQVYSFRLGSFSFVSQNTVSRKYISDLFQKVFWTLAH